MILESWFMVFVDVAPKESATRARGFTYPRGSSASQGLARPSPVGTFYPGRARPVGVRNCDHVLDLRIRDAGRRRASALSNAREASNRPSTPVAPGKIVLSACETVPGRT